MSNLVELMACPFCGSKKIEERDCSEGKYKSYWFGCASCGIETYVGLKKSDARKVWNRRIARTEGDV